MFYVILFILLIVIVLFLNKEEKKPLQIDILLPNKSPEITYSVSALGLVRALTVDVVIDYDNLGKNRKYASGENFQILSTEYPSPDAGVVSFLLSKDSAFIGSLVCSPDAFNIILNELNHKKTMVFRINDPETKETSSSIDVKSKFFSLYSEDSIYGGDQFKAELRNHLKEQDSKISERLISFINRLEIN